MDQYQHANTSKYGLWDSKSLMCMLQERILMIYPIALISSYMQILQELFSTGIQTILFIFIDPIIICLVYIILVSPHNTITLLVIYSLNNIMKVFFLIWIFSTWFHGNLILHTLCFMIKKFSRVKLSYLLLEIKKY